MSYKELSDYDSAVYWRGVAQRLADALEAATSERAAVLAPAPDGQVIIPIARIRELRAAKDAALAAIERVRGIVSDPCSAGCCDFCEGKNEGWGMVLQALDEAPVPDAATEERIDRWMLLVGKAVEERMTAEAERDAAVAAIERVRAIAVRSAVNPLIRIAEILAALDGAPEQHEHESVAPQPSESDVRERLVEAALETVDWDAIDAGEASPREAAGHAVWKALAALDGAPEPEEKP